jgi:hypothetical protein
MKFPFSPGAISLLGFALVLSSGARATARDTDKINWKPLEDAQLKLEGRPLKKWNVYAAEKRKNLVLILLGHRYLTIDLKERAVYELPPSDLQQNGKDFQSEDPTVGGKTVPTSEWLVRDVGPAELVRVKLGDYGRTVEIQLPHRPDLRWAY